MRLAKHILNSCQYMAESQDFFIQELTEPKSNISYLTRLGDAVFSYPFAYLIKGPPSDSWKAYKLRISMD